MFCPLCVHYQLSHHHVSVGPEGEPKAPDSSRELAIKARNASRKLQALSSEARGNLLHQIAAAIEDNQDVILEENEKDCKVSLRFTQLRISLS